MHAAEQLVAAAVVEPSQSGLADLERKNSDRMAGMSDIGARLFSSCRKFSPCSRTVKVKAAGDGTNRDTFDFTGFMPLSHVVRRWNSGGKSGIVLLGVS
jgi:hypothetical protein